MLVAQIAAPGGLGQQQRIAEEVVVTEFGFEQTGGDEVKVRATQRARTRNGDAPVAQFDLHRGRRQEFVIAALDRAGAADEKVGYGDIGVFPADPDLESEVVEFPLDQRVEIAAVFLDAVEGGVAQRREGVGHEFARVAAELVIALTVGGGQVEAAAHFLQTEHALLVLEEPAEREFDIVVELDFLFEIDEQFLVVGVLQHQIAGETRARTVEIDFVFELVLQIVELGKADAQLGFAEAPFLIQLGDHRPAFGGDVVDVGVVGQQVARRRRAHRAADRSRIVVFERTLVLGALGAHEIAEDLEFGGLGLDAPAGVEGIVGAVAGIGLVFPVVEIVGGEVRIVFGTVAIAQARLFLGVVTALDVGTDQHTPAGQFAAVIEATRLLELAIIEKQSARADISAIECEAIAQLDVERARHCIARAPRRGGAHDLDLLDQFGGDAVEEEGTVGLAARHALAVDEDLGVARIKAAQPRPVAFDHVREEGDTRDALERIACSQRLEALEILLVIDQHRLGRVGAVAEADRALHHDFLGGLDLVVLALVGLGDRTARLDGGGKRLRVGGVPGKGRRSGGGGQRHSGAAKQKAGADHYSIPLCSPVDPGGVGAATNPAP